MKHVAGCTLGEGCGRVDFIRRTALSDGYDNALDRVLALLDTQATLTGQCDGALRLAILHLRNSGSENPR